MAICKHYSVCGGCTSQEILYAEQLEKKEEIVHNLFASFEATLKPIMGSDPYFYYRGKMELSFSDTKAGEKFLGLRISSGPQKGRVFLMEECHLCPGWMVEVAKSVYQWWQESTIKAYFPPGDRGSLRTLTLREGDAEERMVILTVSGHPDYALTEEQIQSFKERLIPFHKLSSLVLIRQVAQKKEPTYFIERVLYGNPYFKITLGKLQFQVRPQAFFQPNRFTAALLYEQVLTLGEFTKDDLVYDLYCGTGTIGMLVSPYVKKVIAVEYNEEAVKDGRANSITNGCQNIELLHGDVARLGQLRSFEKADKVIVDPPRAGLGGKAIGHLLALRAKKIIYVSCNPESQLEDCKLLVEGGYKVQLVQPVDQFPHTRHIENIIILEEQKTS